MNTFDSECSSGCDSGWTLYFEQSILSNPLHDIANKHGKRSMYDNYQHHEGEEEEDGDLSMRSDASSGPPHFHEMDICFEDNGNGNGCYYQASMVKNCGKRKKTRGKDKNREVKIREKSSWLDDTASSPAFNLSNNIDTQNKNNHEASIESVIDFSHGFSAAHNEDGSAFQSYRGILNSRLSGNQLQQNQWYGGNGLGMR